MHSALQLTRKQRTRTMRANHRVLIFEKLENILRYNCADRFFHRKRHVSPITRQRSSATRDPRNHTYREIPIVSGTIDWWRRYRALQFLYPDLAYHRITSVLFRESEYKFRLLCQTRREKVPDSRRARKQRLCASKGADEKVWEKLLIRTGERCSLFRFSTAARFDNNFFIRI